MNEVQFQYKKSTKSLVTNVIFLPGFKDSLIE